MVLFTSYACRCACLAITLCGAMLLSSVSNGQAPDANTPSSSSSQSGNVSPRNDAGVAHDAVVNDSEPLGSVDAATNADANNISEDPFAKLTRVTPMGALKPICSIRVRNEGRMAESEAPKRVSVAVRTVPSGARIIYRRQVLGVSPLTLPPSKNNTPMDLVIKAPGRMVLRTRVMRDTTRTYRFKLSPAKIH